MLISIKNYKNIEKLDYQIADNKINLLFGLCGSGKSAISEALQKNDIDFNKKVGSINEPEIFVDSNDVEGLKIEIFNRDILNKYLFDDENKSNNITPILIDDKKQYENAIKQLKSKLDIIENLLINSNPYREKLLNIQKQMGAPLIKGDILKKTSSISSAQKAYYSLSSSSIVKKINKMGDDKFSWIKQGYSYLNADTKGKIKCPFCQKIISKRLHRKLDSLNNFDLKNLKPIKLSDEELNLLHMKTIPVTKNAIDSMAKNMISIGKALRDYEHLEEFIDNCHDISFDSAKIEVPDFCDDFYQNFPDFKQPIQKLLDHIVDFKSIVTDAIKDTKNIFSYRLKTINSLLELYDIPYKINASYRNNVIYDYYLMHVEDKNITPVHRECSLSEGEKIIFSLIFFILENEKKDSDLIIIDDPVSSFDNVKRGLIMSLIIEKLKGKTVLILSHDSVFVKYALIKNRTGRIRKEIGNVDYISSYENISTIPIVTDDISIIDSFVINHLNENPNIPYYVKILLIRLIYEPKKHGVEYRYLSRIIHCDKNEDILKIKEPQTEESLLKKIKEETGISIPLFSRSFYKSICVDELTIFEKTLLLREMDSRGIISIEKERPVVNDFFHLNSIELKCLNPFKYPMCTKHLQSIIFNNVTGNIDIE